MNFITKFFESKNFVTRITYDIILMIVDRLIKYAHFVSFKKTYTTKKLKFVILNKLVQYHDIF